MIKTKSILFATTLFATTMAAQAANMTESMVQNYAVAMKQAANSKNINQVAKLVSDDALISLSRKGKITSLDKSAYLNLLQNSWQQATSYHYDIQISNVVTTADQAKADVKTTETWVKNGQKTTFVTQSRATLVAGEKGAVLLRAVSQATIN